ncbi:hypothetical protein POM88_033081 [Heracleum sosnowskyi]|uniref:Uncharacterized protein n=1 Tax=Heracleum sosnowskyi TaxID=360622 RepID=A0AAD8I2W8_9APIA|nr:hypothetical protein POM88_033081 [Heracleum sosnowskyi]
MTEEVVVDVDQSPESFSRVLDLEALHRKLEVALSLLQSFTGIGEITKILQVAMSQKWEITSTCGTRGTVCYIALDYGGGEISETCDVYSFNWCSLLVLVPGRRSLVAWSRQLAEAFGIIFMSKPLSH